MEDVNCMLRSQTSQNLRARMLTFSDPRDFNKLKLGVKQLLPQHCAEFSSALSQEFCSEAIYFVLSSMRKSRNTNTYVTLEAAKVPNLNPGSSTQCGI